MTLCKVLDDLYGISRQVIIMISYLDFEVVNPLNENRIKVKMFWDIISEKNKLTLVNKATVIKWWKLFLFSDNWFSVWLTLL